MKTIIAGSRHFSNQILFLPAVRAAVAFLEANTKDKVTEVVSGTANGIDTIGEIYAEEAQLPVSRFPANWEAHGKVAGHMRNRDMALYGEALILIWDGASKGSSNMYTNAARVGLPILNMMYDAENGEFKMSFKPKAVIL